MGAWRGIMIGLAGAVMLLAFPAAPATGKEIHVDCSSPTAGDGSTPATPLNSIAQPFNLRASDQLRFRRGTTCEGELRITDSGQGADPKAVGAYGTGAKPKIVGTGRDAVWIRDVSDLTVQDLDISNPGNGGPLGEGEEVRNGIRVVSQTVDVRNLTLTGLEIHDVGGDLTKNPEGSAAIQVSATGPPPARFVNLHLTGNRISSVSRSGISVSGTNDLNRPDADRPWPNASSGMVIEKNRINLIAGDGIVTRGTDGAIVRGNAVSRGNLAGRPLTHPDGPMCNAGIWAFRANNTVIRGNEVFGMKHKGCDGTGFDVDYRQDGTIIESNYSHHNEGGFVLLCTDSATHRADVRFNLSVDDGTMINHGPCGIAEGVTGSLSGIRMFNNTVVGTSPTVSIQLTPTSPMFAPGDFQFRNNLVYSRTPLAGVACGSFCSHNAFYGLPASGSKAFTGNPFLAGPLTGGTGIEAAKRFRLTPASKLRGRGIPVPDGAAVDFFGNPVPARPAIGFDQSPRKTTGPSRACRKAKDARGAQQKKVKKLTTRLKRIKRQKWSRGKKARVKKASRRLRQARTELKRRTRLVRQKCRKA